MNGSNSSRSNRPRILITNDDGPPTDMSGGSPFVYPLAKALIDAGHDVKVCLPDGQRSWVSNSYLIAQTTTGKYFYPQGPDGTRGERTDLPRPVRRGEVGEWVLLSGTPATCANIMLHSLYPAGSFDLVVSGPNLGRNTGSAFAMSSGTIGAAMSAALTGVPAIALSWGLMTHYKPPSQEIRDAATRVSVDLIQQIWDMGFGKGDDRVDVYSVNIPLMPSITVKGGPEVRWTTLLRNHYGRLFKSIADASAPPPAEYVAGPAVIAEDEEETAAQKEEDRREEIRMHQEHFERPLKFAFAPDIGGLVNPHLDTVPQGTDTRAILDGAVSITPLRTAFAEASVPSNASQSVPKWRL